MIQEVMKEINQVMAQVDETQLHHILPLFTHKRRIFVRGAGRSGFQAKGFAMRLMHLGYEVYVLGETITPSVKEEDLFIAISGSGTTKGVLMDAISAKEKGLTLLVFTSNPQSELAQIADALVVIPGATKTGSGIESIQLLSSLFDQTLHITLDVLCLMLSRQQSVAKDEILQAHVNIE